MADLNVAAHVTRAELGLGNLDINDGDIYTLSAQVDPGQVSWRREEVQSPFVEGAIIIAQVRDNPNGNVIIEVEGTTAANLQSRIQTLVNAFTQSEFELHISVDGTLYAWECYAADYQIGFVNTRFYNKQVPAAFSFPRSPIAVSGPV